MNNTTLENTSLLPCFDNTDDEIVIPNMASPILRLPVNIYILQLIISRHWITSEFYTFKEAIFEIFICFYDFVGIAEFFFQNKYLMMTKMFFLGFIITGRPCLLTVICVDRYLAVVKPVVFLKIKPLKYKLTLSGIIWLCTLVSCACRTTWHSILHYVDVVQISLCCVVQLYCCIATLLALKQPGPGGGVRQKEGMNNMKLKAFKIISIITASVILVYIPLTVVVILKDYLERQLFLTILNVNYTCTAVAGFVHTLLFLQRSGKLPFIKCLAHGNMSVNPS